MSNVACQKSENQKERAKFPLRPAGGQADKPRVSAQSRKTAREKRFTGCCTSMDIRRRLSVSTTAFLIVDLAVGVAVFAVRDLVFKEDSLFQTGGNVVIVILTFFE